MRLKKFLAPRLAVALLALGLGAGFALPATAAAHIMDVVTAAANGSHKLVVNVLGTAGHPRIDVDAFVVLSNAPHWRWC